MKKRALILIIFVTFLAWSGIAQAGFGISPPYVRPIKAVFPGSHYEQKITILRSPADSDMMAIVTLNAPEISDWISIDKGFEFPLPKDERKVEMIVKVDVPSGAEIGNYKGSFNIKMAPKDADRKPGVAIALGARVDIDIDVTNEELFDFAVKRLIMQDIGVLKFPWNLRIFSFFFYRVKAALRIENLGNVPAGPTKVYLDVYDIEDKILLESYEDTSIEKVEPFKTSDVLATFPTKLAAGHYWGRVKVYMGNDIIHKDKATFEIKPEGELVGYKHWLLLSGYVSILLLFALSLVKVRVWRYVFFVLFFLSWPLRYVGQKIIQLKKHITQKFWEEMSKKAENYKKDSGPEEKSKKE